jgi:carboxyl-terminal processing protease
MIESNEHIIVSPSLKRNRRGLFARRLAAAALLWLAAACTTPTAPAPEPAKAPSEVARMFALVLENVHDIYIDEHPIDDLAIAGLRGLQKVEPSASIERAEGQIRLLINGTVVSAIPAPERNDGEAWAAVIEKMIADGRRASTKLNAADNEKIYKTMIDGLLAGLDRYSRYSGMVAARRQRQNRDGFGGIGVSIKIHDDGVRVDRVTPERPASRGGVKIGDIIVAVGGAPLKGLKLRKTVALLRGPIGKQVTVTLRREGRPEPFELSLLRVKIVPVTVYYQRRDRIAYLRVTGFNQGTALELRKSVDRARREIGAGLKGLVIDLRGNPGGLLDQAVDTADLFIVKGRISTTRGRHPDSFQLFDATKGDIGAGVPIAVLVNGASASASEVLAAALQDRGRAVLVGSGSFGKGTVQTVLRMPNDGELILTWARLLAPSGYILNKLGVLPTLCTSNADDAEHVLADSLKDGVADRQIAMRRAADNGDEEFRETVRTFCPWRPRDGRDVDIEVAKRLLETPKLYQRALQLSALSAGS